MITARRLRQRTAGEPTSTQVRPTSITVEQHKRALQDLTREYEQKLARGGGPRFEAEGLDEMLAEITTLEQAKDVLRDAARGAVEGNARIEALSKEVLSKDEQLVALRKENSELSQLLESATAAPATSQDPPAVAAPASEAVPPAEAQEPAEPKGKKSGSKSKR